MDSCAYRHSKYVITIIYLFNQLYNYIINYLITIMDHVCCLLSLSLTNGYTLTAVPLYTFKPISGN